MIASIVGIQDALTSIASIVQRILTCARTQSAPTGQAEAKADLKTVMLKKTFLACSGLKALASATDDKQLSAQVNYWRSTLGRGRESDVTIRCQSILDLATERAALLAAKYNVNADDLTAVREAIEAFSGALPRPRQSIVVSAGATSELVDLFADLDEGLNNQLDPLMEKFQETEPTFFHEYEGARVVVDAAATHGSKDAPSPVVTNTSTNVTPAPTGAEDTTAATTKVA